MSKYTGQQLDEALSNLNRSVKKTASGGLKTELEHDILWRIKNNKLHKTLIFDDFKQAFAFMSKIAVYAEEKNHHPEWKNIYNRVEIELTTHDKNGISFLDFDFAKKIETVIAEKHKPKI